MQNYSVEICSSGIFVHGDGNPAAAADLSGIPEPADLRLRFGLQQAGHEQEVLLLCDGGLLGEVRGSTVLCTEDTDIEITYLANVVFHRNRKEGMT